MDVIVETAASDAAPATGILVGGCAVTIWGMTSVERLRRTLQRAGVPQVGARDDAPRGPRHIMLRTDWVFDEALVRDLLRAPMGTILADPATGQWVAAHVGGEDTAPVAGALLAQGLPEEDLSGRVTVRGPSDLSSAYNHALRKREAPYLMQLTRETLPAVEARMFNGSYKGVTDLITKYVWPWPARHVTKFCAVAGISPNQVTFASLLLVAATTWLFSEGMFLPGLASAWVMTFLDTVDGKLARVTLTSSRWGNVFDHGIDLVHPPFWWWAWVAGLGESIFSPTGETVVLAVVLGGYVVLRVFEGLFLSLHGIEIHVWRRFDSLFRLIVARRNINLLLLTAGALAGAPAAGMIAVAVWTAVSTAVHAVQIVAASVAVRSRPIVSWLTS